MVYAWAILYHSDWGKHSSEVNIDCTKKTVCLWLKQNTTSEEEAEIYLTNYIGANSVLKWLFLSYK